ncbi:HMGL-like protein [Klosneuvirus KNV1]|uniref:HMGL-like protein n=1 Tax=Klosneuvirus KNV1 TaxID=1977640 RepID=A0A1V0SKU2_9VIRU|nr:HMGL-like protein [Klosneuvirus KNV1]
MIRAFKLIEVGPRDGLQAFKHKIISPQVKANYINKLIDSGIKNIEVGSFVSDKIIQMKNTPEVIPLINRKSDTNLITLVGNLKYAQEAIKYNINEFAVFTTISETFCQKNNGCSIDTNLKKIYEVVKFAHENNIRVRGYISCVFGCPFEGYDESYIRKTKSIVKDLLGMGCYEVSIADTIGMANPQMIITTLKPLYDYRDHLAIHLHDPIGKAKYNLVTAICFGINNIDCATGGIGGCPAAKDPGSNIDTETVIKLLNEFNYYHNIDLVKIQAASKYIRDEL